MSRKYSIVVCGMMLMTLLSGCLFRPVEDLYRLPERFSGDESLLNEVTRVRRELELQSDSVEYANIFSGDHTATIQLQDLDSDGVRETAVTFFHVPDAENSLQIYFFTKVGEADYQLSGVVRGEGTAIYAVDFIDLNGFGKKEIVVSWQTRGAYQLGAYTLDDQSEMTLYDTGDSTKLELNDPALSATQILETAYSAYSLIDIDQNGLMEVAVAHVNVAGINSYLEVFGWRDGTMLFLDTVPLSGGISTLSSITSNFVSDFIPALYLSSTLMDEGRATDIVTYQDGNLINLTLNSETGKSWETLREYGDIGPADINNDAILELPRPKSLPIYGAGAVSDYWLIEWSQYNSDGRAETIFTTYHNLSDGWYLIIPENWIDNITISRDDTVSGQRTVIFSRWNGADEEPTPFLAIYKLTGPNRFTRAEHGERFELGGDSTTIYAASFFDSDWDSGLDEIEILQHFGLIINSWASS